MGILSLTVPDDDTHPRAGDTRVVIRCEDPSLSLQERMNMLGYAFAKIVQGVTLRRIITWDLTEDGYIEFVVGNSPAKPTSPHGKYSVTATPWLED